MALSVLVRTYTGEILARSVHRAHGQLCSSARKEGLPLLADVDPYDDTIFNSLQVKRLAAELESLRQSVSTPEDEAISEVVELIELVLVKPHRYLVFNGD